VAKAYIVGEDLILDAPVGADHDFGGAEGRQAKLWTFDELAFSGAVTMIKRHQDAGVAHHAVSWVHAAHTAKGPRLLTAFVLGQTNSKCGACQTAIVIK
jgi:hypothetical protein